MRSQQMSDILIANDSSILYAVKQNPKLYIKTIDLHCKDFSKRQEWGKNLSQI